MQLHKLPRWLRKKPTPPLLLLLPLSSRSRTPPRLIENDLSTDQVAAIAKAYANINAQLLMPVASLPFDANHNAADLIQFTPAVREFVTIMLVACEDAHPTLWVRGWETCLKRHVSLAVRNTDPQASKVMSTIDDSCAHGGRMLDACQPGPVVLEHVIRALCRGLSTVTPVLIMQALQNLTVEAGIPFSVFWGQMRLLVSHVRCVGQVASDEGAIQLAIKTCIDDQYASLGAQIIANRNMRALPFDSVDGLMRVIEDLSLNNTRASASSRGLGVLQTYSHQYSQGYRSRQHAGVMSVASDDFVADNDDFGHVFAVGKYRNSSGRFKIK